MREIIEAHKFFVRKSQHYMLGDWSEYQDWFINGYKFNNQLLRYYKGFVPAYIKFMWFSLTNK